MELRKTIQKLVFVPFAACAIGALFSAGAQAQTADPVASAGSDQIAELGEIIELDGSASISPSGDELTYSWSIVSGPGSATLSDSTLVRPTLTPDASGDYVIELTVSDGTATSTADSLIVSTTGIVPVSDAGRDREIGRAHV